MNPYPEHLVIAPIVVPLIAGAMLLFFDDRRRWLKAAVSVVAAVVLLAVSILLLRVAQADDGRVYLLGNWPPPFAIVLVLDRLSAIMLALTATLAIPALIFSLARWHKAGAHFHTLFLFLLMGLNGAFLTGDLFNLFVFFEVMLAASYGLMLHGSGPFRITAGMHYIAMNLVASLLVLIGVSLIYGVTGTLNMADLAQHIPKVAAENRTMLEAGAAVLGVAFLVKAGMWPLCFWLPSAYAAAAAPVAATFAIMSKVGVYVLLRLSLLFFGERAGPSAGFGSEVLLFGGMATIAFGAIGVLASRRLGHIAGFSVLVSSGTLLASISLSQTGVTAGALFYLVSSTLTMGAFFLLIELVERGQEAGANVFAVATEAYDERDETDEEDEDVGILFPGTIAALGISFAACGILLAGLPPLSGFVAKFAILSAMLNPEGLGKDGAISPVSWWLIALIILSGLSALIAMSRAGIRAFWAPVEPSPPRVLLVEMAPVATLLGLTLVFTLEAGRAMRFMEATAASLHSPIAYVDKVMEAPRVAPRQEPAP